MPTQLAPHPRPTPEEWESLVDSITRRDVLVGGVALAAVAVLGGCSNDDGTDDSAADTRRVEHRYGTTDVPSRPERVVTVGLVDHDAVLALGTVPVALTADAFSADQPHGVWPWAQDFLEGAKPEVLDALEVNFERIAALEPDLILAVYAGITEDDYQTLSEIAPTVAQPVGHEDYQAPWDVMTRHIGEALGARERAEELIGEVDQAFADARAAHPEFGGQLAVYAGLLEPGQYYAETEGSSRVGILTALGFESPDNLRGDELYVEVSTELVDTLDHDVLVWELGDPASRSIIESDQVYRQTEVAAEGRDVFVLDPVLAGAMALISVLSLPHVITELVPMLAAAVDGDPATVIPTG